MKNYNCTFQVDQPAAHVYESICDVADWWTTHITGQSHKINDTFTITFGETVLHFKIVEGVPYQKITWLVTDSYIHWLNDKSEWTNTKLIFEIQEMKEGTCKVSITHSGLVPEVECFENCKKGWDFYAGVSLRKLITEGKGLPDTPMTARATS